MSPFGTATEKQLLKTEEIGKKWNATLWGLSLDHPR